MPIINKTSTIVVSLNYLIFCIALLLFFSFEWVQHIICCFINNKQTIQYNMKWKVFVAGFFFLIMPDTILSVSMSHQSWSHQQPKKNTQRDQKKDEKKLHWEWQKKLFTLSYTNKLLCYYLGNKITSKDPSSNEVFSLTILSNILIKGQLNFALWKFSLFKLSLFEQAAIRLAFLPRNVSHYKQACFYSRFTFPAHFSLSSSKRSDIFIDPFLYLRLYIKPLVSININSSALIVFLFVKIITGIFDRLAHLIIARNFCLWFNSSS